VCLNRFYAYVFIVMLKAFNLFMFRFFPLCEIVGYGDGLVFAAMDVEYCTRALNDRVFEQKFEVFIEIKRTFRK